MKILKCGNIKKDEVMDWCINEGVFTQKAQSQYGYDWASSDSEELEIYTNIDHFFNGVRIAVMDGKCKAEDIYIIFFPEVGLAYHPEITKDGRVMNWPRGFFDQWEKDLSKLIGWA